MPILQTSKSPLPPMPQRLRSHHMPASDIKCGKNVAGPGMKLVTKPADRPNEGRMPRLEIRPSGRTPGGIFSSARKRGGVEQDRTRTQTIPEISGWRTRPNFLAKFLGKNFGNKNRVVSIPEERVLRQRRSRMKL